MQIQCDINQTDAIRRGFNASSTAKIEVDITTLTQPQRDALARRFSDGKLKYPTLSEPTITGFLEALDAKAAEDAKEKQEKEEREAKLSAELSVYRARFAADPAAMVEMNRNGSAYLVDRPSMPGYYGYGRETYRFILGDELFAQFSEIEARFAAENNACEEAAKAERMRDAEAAQAKADERKAALEEQRKTHLAAHPGPLAERFAAGYASASEVDDAIRDEVRATLGASYTGGDSGWSRDDSDALENPVLTDEQFAVLKTWKAKLPEDAKISLFDMHDHADNGYGDKDDETKIDRILVAEARWTVGQLTVCADEQIGTLEDVTKDEDSD